MAALHGHKSVVVYLVDKGANINAEDMIQVCIQDRDGGRGVCLCVCRGGMANVDNDKRMCVDVYSWALLVF